MLYKEITETLKNLKITNFKFFIIIIDCNKQTVKLIIDYWGDQNHTILIHTNMFLNGWYDYLFDILSNYYNLTSNITNIIIDGTNSIFMAL